MSTATAPASSTTVVFLDMRHETDLSTLPVGTLIITVGPTENVTHEDRQYMKCQLVTGSALTMVIGMMSLSLRI
mgnify:CR=1 FL=1|jgi:hypothetical protein